MIEGIKQIGNIAKQELEPWEMALGTINPKEGIKYKIAKINFDTDNEKVKVDLNEEYTKEESEKKYKFVKLRLTGRQNQFYATFTDKKRLIGEDGKPYSVWLSVIEEIENLTKFEPNLEKFQQINNLFYSIEQDNKDKKKKNRKLNIETINDFHCKKEEIAKRNEKNNKNDKEIKNIDVFNEIIKLGNNEEIGLWTILIDGTPIVDMPFYDEILKQKILEDKRQQGEIICSLCGNKANSYFDDFARFLYKYFINDKFGFSQNLTGDFKENFVLCEHCYLDIFAGQKLIDKELSARIGLINYMIIPEFINEPNFNYEQIKNWSDYIKTTLNPFNLLNDQGKFEQKLQDYKDFEDKNNEFLLNYLFYEQNNQEFKIFGLIKDVPSSNIRKLQKIYTDVSTKFKNIGFDFVKNDISSVYWLIPLRKSGTKIAEIPKITHIFSSILNRFPLNLYSLVKDFTLGINTKYYGNPAYNITNDQLESYIIQTNAFLIFLRKLNLLPGGTNMSKLDDLPGEFNDYIEKCKFSDLQIALFLIGTLIGDVGSKQAKYGNKPILNKINFQGMTQDRIGIIHNEIYEKLVQEKLLYPEKEKIYAISKELIDKNKHLWSFSPHESVYYLLSGYAFKTLMNIKAAKNKKGGEHAEQR